MEDKVTCLLVMALLVLGFHEKIYEDMCRNWIRPQTCITLSFLSFLLKLKLKEKKKQNKHFSTLTKKGIEAFADCHKDILPSPSQAPNLLPCTEKRMRLTLAKTPEGRTGWTHWLCDHSHIRIEPS